MVELINALMEFWISTDPSTALIIATFVNAAIYLLTAYGLFLLTRYLVNNSTQIRYVNTDSLKQHQIRKEIGFSLISCLLFAATSLFTRHLFEQLWPASIIELIVEVMAFVIFYEIYSYGVHRVLHCKPFRRAHGVHHRSVRVTPFSAYSVHPLEAFLIGISAPLFLLVFPISLGVIFILHVTGMMFTIFIHSNLRVETTNRLVEKIVSYSLFHEQHHRKGQVNFGFTSVLLDKLLKTQSG